jgi:hypothetical protein
MINFFECSDCLIYMHSKFTSFSTRLNSGSPVMIIALSLQAVDTAKQSG